MRKRDLLKQLHNLKSEIKPDADWKKSNREILAFQIKAQTSDAIQNKIVWSNLLAKKFMTAVYKPVGAMILIFGIALGGYVMTVGATKNSLPGDFLYPVKITSERMKINMANDEGEKANLEIEFAERRLEELKKVSEKAITDDSQKENVKVSLQKYQESINNVKNSLAKLEKTDTTAAVKVAKLIEEKTKDYVEIINQEKDKNPDVIKTEAANEAISVSKSTAEKALEMIMNEFKAGSKEVTLDTVIQRLEKKVADSDLNLTKYKADLDTIIANIAAAKALADKKAAEEKAAAEAAAKAAAEVKAEETVTTSETGTAPAEVKTEPVPDANVNQAVEAPQEEIKAPEVPLPTPEEIKVKLAQVRGLLDQARGYLVTKEVLWSYAKIMEADQILGLARQVIEANKVMLEAPQEEPAEPVAEPEPAVEPVNANAAPEEVR